jgi:intracellular multiplication protein IcmJ
MNSYPVTLGVSRLEVRKTSASATKEIKSGAVQSGSVLSSDLRQKIFDRDSNTCQCCGFTSKKYQEVHHKDMNPHNHEEQNLVTMCIFCHQCFQLDRVSTMRSGVLIWMPEIEQTVLHHIARAIYVARISQGPIAEAARKSLDVIMARRDEVKRRIQTDDPYILSTVLQDYLSAGAYKARSKKLEGVRLFPLDRRIIKEADLEFNQFPQILAYWRSKDGPFGGKAPSKWVSIYQNVLKQAA